MTCNGLAPRLQYPNNAGFAFTILDDTDDATVQNVKPIYNLLSELGMRTTKTVWPLDCPEGSHLYFAGQTLEDTEYLEFVIELVQRGFEIASHNATMESSFRARTIQGMAALRQYLGVTPVVHCNHGQNRENIYWGHDRLRTGVLRMMRSIVQIAMSGPKYSGHDPDSPYFWGDLCKEHYKFVRNFAFASINSGAIPPFAPYRERSTPWVNYWFSTTDAPDRWYFLRLFTRKNIHRLIREGGSCIVSTHLGKGFVADGIVHPAVEDVLRFVASQGGWFPTVSELLEFQLAHAADEYIQRTTRWKLELMHVVDRVRNRLNPPLTSLPR